MFGPGKKLGKQWVCKVCGYNMIGECPDRCPFCGAQREQIDTMAAIGRRYRVIETPVNETVSQLRSAPKLGLEHAAYRIEADGGAVWVDSPAVYTETLEPVQAILFTHKDFIGAANLYKDKWGAEVWLHEADAELSEVGRHSIDHPFSGNFSKFGVEAIHIGGHSPGFTIYIWQDVLFVCDYAYPPGAGMKLNPHGRRDETREGAGRLAAAVASRSLKTVCGYNYAVGFEAWRNAFLRLI